MDEFSVHPEEIDELELSTTSMAIHLKNGTSLLYSFDSIEEARDEYVRINKLIEEYFEGQFL